jgi:uncharacterized protein
MNSQTSKHTNNLIHSSSPYLLQHAHNPVNWFEWSDEAFEKAKREDKLVLISIGYSACHWCHVMERESFEKEDTAAIMNEYFVCIKVDREERPDVDQIYMDAVQLLTGQGGWPLNCITLPDGRPIHGGTYFPKSNWEVLLEQLADFYKHSKPQALQYATDLVNGIKELNIIQPSEESSLMSFEKLSEVINNFKKNFDLEKGGYNWSPKFPMPNNWELFMQFHHHTKDETLKKAVQITLIKMAEGGIYDQVGAGFARYSTDSFWKAPHFEKMLYDNAQLMSLYSFAYQQNKNDLYKKIVYQTHEFILRELTSNEGFFYSALDADSEGVEGKFYVWTKAELQNLLGDDEHLFSIYYSVEEKGNWEYGNNILYKTKTNEEIEKVTGKSISEIEKIVRKCNTILLDARSKRVRPGLDDKMITSWNALMIKGYTDAFKVFGDHKFLKVATDCTDFLLGNMLKENQLFRICKNQKVTISAFAEDYASLCEALISLYEVCGDESYLIQAKKLMEISIDLFYDSESKLFYFKSKNDEQLIARKIDMSDDVIPSANSMFAKCLFQLGFLFDETNYHKIVDEMLLAVQSKIERFPTGYSNWMQVLLWKQKGFYQIIISGKNADEVKKELQKFYLPNALILALNNQSSIPLLADKTISDEIKIYVCKDKTCGLPLSNVLEAIKHL